MKRLFFLLILIALVNMAHSQPEMRPEDRARIKETIDINKNFGEKVWQGISETPFSILLVTDSVEFLINHPYPSLEFSLLNYDTLLQTEIFYRKTTFSKHLLATFTVEGLSCVVIGTPENTGLSTTAWITTLLHEHFHQYQEYSPDFFSNVAELELTGGDQTGMWMLNYPFPYSNDNIVQQYNKYVNALSRAVRSIDKKGFDQKLELYLSERKEFRRVLDTSDYKYFSFQVWKEGIARYTEYKFLQLLENYHPSPEVAALTDFIPFHEYREKLYESELNSLKNLELDKNQRVCFYAIGFAEGLILDNLDTEWHHKYLTDKFFVEKYDPVFGD